MKKITLTLSYFCFIVLAFSFRVSASYLPPVAPDTSSLLPFLQTVAQQSIINDSYSYVPTQDLNQLNRIVNGRNISESLNYVYLDNSQINYDIFGGLYTIDGVEVGQNDTYTVFGTSDIGQFTMICEKSTGKILYQGDGSLEGTRSTLWAGTNYRENFPSFITRELAGLTNTFENVEKVLDAVKEAQGDSMIVYGNSLTASDKEFLSDYRFYFRMTSNLGWSVYVPNACSNEVLVQDVGGGFRSYHGDVPVGNPNNMQPIIFSTDPSQVYFSGSGSWVGLKQESTSYFGNSFTYTSSYRNAYGVLYQGGHIDMELPTQSEFNQYKAKVSDSVYLQPVTDIDNPNTGDTYNYTYVTNNPPVSHRYINNNYNYSGDTNYNNYPTYYNYEYPTYPENNYIQNIYNYYTTPNTGETIGNISDPILPENIPILSNLEYRFPFSIPFDMYKLAQGLSVPRETPYINTTIIIPGINYEWNIQYDLHAFDNIADLARTLELILFIVGLAIFSYDHFFGS